MQLLNSVKQLQSNYFQRFQVVNKQELYNELKSNTTFHKIQRNKTKSLSVISIIVFACIRVLYIHRQYGLKKSFNTERIKSVDFPLE